MMAEAPLADAIVRFIRDNDLDTLDGAFGYENDGSLAKPGLGRRARLRIEFRDEDDRCWRLYMKRYESPSAWEKFKRLVTFRRAWCEARDEFDNICRAREAGVPTMRAIICGAQFGRLGTSRNYLIVTSVPGDAVERVGEDFFSKYADNFDMLEEFNTQLFRMVSRLHLAGMTHRDLYASHIFLYEHDGMLELNLIDLARVIRPKYRKFRWRVKDLAQLKFSMPEFWVKNYFDRFLEKYLGRPSANELDRWRSAIDARIDCMCRQQQRRAARKARGERK